MQNHQKQARESIHDARCVASNMAHLCPTKKLKQLPSRLKASEPQILHIQANNVAENMDNMEKLENESEVIRDLESKEIYASEYSANITGGEECDDSLKDLEAELKKVYKTRKIQYAHLEKLVPSGSTVTHNYGSQLENILRSREKSHKGAKSHSPDDSPEGLHSLTSAADKFIQSTSGKISSKVMLH